MRKLKVLIVLFSVFMLLGSCSKDEDVIEPKPPIEGVDPTIAVDSTQTFNEILSGQAEASRLGLRFKFSDFEPTGVYVKPNTTLELQVERLEGTTIPVLLVGTYSRGTHWNKEPVSYELTEGKNTLNIGAEGGLVYVRYITGNNPTGKTKIKFLKGWKHSPVYKINTTTSQNWKKMLSTFTEAPSATLIGSKSILVVSRVKAVTYQDENTNNVLKAIDDVLQLQNDLSGMDGSSSIHNPMSHKLLLSEYTGSDYYMFAYNYRTAYSSTGVPFILSEQSFTTDGWGPWHEMGHMHQMDAWTWNEVIETTVNLYSLASERAMGVTPSRMKRQNKWAEVQSYLAQEESNKNFNASSTNVWVRLGMFYQLQLAFGDDFYKTLHKMIRVDKPAISSDDHRMRVFMLYACKAANKDLTAFFKAWGYKFSTVNNVYNEIAALGFEVPNTDITQLQE
jgi:hypothetical protein